MWTVFCQCIYTFAKGSKRKIDKLSLFEQVTFTAYTTNIQDKACYTLKCMLDRNSNEGPAKQNRSTDISSDLYNITNIPDLSNLSDPARSTTSNLLFRTLGNPLPPAKLLFTSFS
jgi:hypothetical protein